jgi:hypothetical protein
MFDDIMPPVMTGATAGTAGAKGLVPVPAAGDEDKMLHGDGTFRASSNASAATNADVIAGTSTTTFVTPAGNAYALAARTNALAPRGGVAFDGTASSRVYSTLTNQNLATDAASVELGFSVPATNPSAVRGLWSLASSATDGVQANAVACWISTSNALVARIYGAATTDYNEISLSLTPWTGKEVRMCLTRTGTTVVLYINGVAQTVSTSSGGTPPTWAGSITSTYFNAGFLASATPFVGQLRGATLYNLALSAADVLEINELGGAVPERFKFGSQVAINTGVWSTSGSPTVATNTAASIDFTRGASTGYFRSTEQTGVKLGTYYRARGTTTTNTTGNLIHLSRQIGGADSSLVSVSGAASGTPGLYYASLAGTGAWELVFTRQGGTSPAATALEIQIQTAAGQLAANSISFVQLGAVVHLPLDDGIGYQLHDQSTNKLDAVMTTTGVSHIAPRREAWIRATTNTSGNQQLFGASLIGSPSQYWRIRSWTIMSSGTPTVSLGNASGGAQYASGVALVASPTQNEITLLTRTPLTQALWCNSNSTATLEHYVVLELIN